MPEAINEMEKLIVLMKFGEKEHIENLFNKGEIFFNTPLSYSESSERERGDIYEGAEWVENVQLSEISFNHPKIGVGKLTPAKNSLSRLIQYNTFFLSTSFYAITSKTFENTDQHQINKRIVDFKGADAAIMIKDPIRFLNSITSKLKENRFQYEARIVKYRDFKIGGRVDLTPFEKDIDFVHQLEFRIIIENKENKPNNKVFIDSIAEYSLILDAKSMVELTWKVKRRQ